MVVLSPLAGPFVPVGAPKPVLRPPCVVEFVVPVAAFLRMVAPLFGMLDIVGLEPYASYARVGEWEPAPVAREWEHVLSS